MAQAIKKIKVGDETHPIDGAFYLGTLTTVAGSGSSGSYKSVRWYVSDCEGVTAPYDGMRIAIKIPLAGVGTAGVMLSINGNNDADYHPLAYNVNTVLTTHFPVNSIKVFVYDASQKMTCYKTANTAVSVTGVWKADSNYDSNTTVTYGTLEYYFRPYVATEALYRYKFVMLDKDNRLVPLTTTNVANGTAVTNQTPTAKAFRPDKIWWYATTTTISAGAVVGAQTLWRSGYNANNTTNGGMAICNFNSTISAYRLIYLCGTFDKTTGLFSLRGGGTASSTQYYTQVPTNTANLTLSSYFTSGYDYILLGGTYSSNNYIQLFDNNPMFHFDGTNLVPYDTWNTAQASSNQKVQGNGTGFGADATVNIVGGGNVTVTGDATNNKITVSYTTPGSLKNPNALDIYGNTTSVLSYDGGAKKSLYFKSSTSLGYFTVGDGTTSQAVYVGYSNTDTHYTSTFTVYGGSTSVATFNQSANMTLSFAAGNNVTLTPDATNHKITISATNTNTWRPIDIYGENILNGTAGGDNLNFTTDADTIYAGNLYPVYFSYLTGNSSINDGIIAGVDLSSLTYSNVGAASAGHAHSGVYLPYGTYYAGNLAISTTSATNKSLTLSYLGTNTLGTSVISYPGTMNIIATPAIVGQGDGGTLSLYGGSHVFLATNNSTYFDMNSQSTVFNTASNMSVYAMYIGLHAGDGTATGNIYASTYSANLKIKNTYIEGNYFAVSTTGNIYISGPSTTTAYLMVSGYYNYLVGYSYVHITGSSHVLLSTSNTGASNYVAIQRGAYASRPAVAGWQHNIRVYLAGKCYARFQLYSGTSTAVTTMSTMATMLNGCGHTTADTAVMATGRGTASSGYVVNGIYATGNYNSNVYLTCAAYAAGLTSTNNYGGNSISSAAVTDYVKVVQS